MESLIKKLEDASEAYIDSIQNKPISTIIKTLVIIWLINKIKKALQ